jgi:hypothetical protein
MVNYNEIIVITDIYIAFNSVTEIKIPLKELKNVL